MDPRALWDDVAPAWDRYRARIFDETRPLSEWLIEQVAPGPGRTIVEITAGAGDTSFLAAGRGGTIICSDLSPAMIEAARREAATRGIDNVEFRVMDATRLDLGDASVDGVMSRFGLMLVPDQEAALAEAHRVLTPGARLAYTVPAPPEKNPWAGLLGVAASRLGIALSAGDPYAPGGMFSLSTPERNHDLVRAAGFSSIEIGTLQTGQRFADFEEYWQTRMELAAVTRRLIATLPAEQARALYDEAASIAADYREPDGALAFAVESITVRAVR